MVLIDSEELKERLADERDASYKVAREQVDLGYYADAAHHQSQGDAFGRAIEMVMLLEDRAKEAKDEEDRT